MPTQTPAGQTINILIVGQKGRLQYEAILFAASLRHTKQSRRFKLFVAEPQDNGLWPNSPRISDPDIRALLQELDATILPFDNRHFGHAYPYGNKIEALFAMPPGKPFLFFDTDTLITGDLGKIPFDFSRPTASMRREGTWPQPDLYGPGYTDIWKSLYNHFELNFESSLDDTHPDEYWQRYLYFNAGFFFFRCPLVFGSRFLEVALDIRNNPPRELAGQSLDPWLDQIALPLTIHGLGGGRKTIPSGHIDGDTSCHYRLLPLLYARESDSVVKTLEDISRPNRIKKILKQYDPFKRMIYQGRGQKVRDLFDRDNLPRKEQAIRNRIKREGFWMR